MSPAWLQSCVGDLPCVPFLQQRVGGCSEVSYTRSDERDVCLSAICVIRAGHAA
jgi:hypothetical protein